MIAFTDDAPAAAIAQMLAEHACASSMARYPAVSTAWFEDQAPGRRAATPTWRRRRTQGSAAVLSSR